MIRIMHISDTHILTNKRHDEYRKVFEQIYDLAYEQQVTHIVHTGDLFHSKLQLTPECVALAVEFLRKLSDIAPVYMICGNHDCTVRNTKRLDSITPIVDAINSDRIHYFKKSGEYSFGDVTFGAFSMLDPDNYPNVSDPNKLNIALYHGSISGVMTDSGYVISHGDCDVQIFKGYDYALLGDIHLSYQKVDDDGRCAYAGSTVQQNFGETDDKGVLIWNIKDKNNFECKHYSFKCPKPFVTLELNNDGLFDEWRVVPQGARIRLQTYYNLSVDRVKAAIEGVKNKWKPESVTFVSKALVSKESLENVSNLSRVMNLRDVEVQEELISEYLKQYNPSAETLDSVFELNRKLNLQVQQNEEVGRNINWKLKSLEWDNLFNYGEGNKLDFTKLKGVVGILGKNFSGKSSAGIDTLMYTLFNTTSKNARKNLNIINQNCERGRGRAVLEIDGNEHIVERKSEKYTKKSKGVLITEAKTDVEFTGVDETTLTGLDRNDTDKVIRKYLGTVDDFMLTSVATQFSAQSFIGEGSTNRKAILAKFLDLDLFEAKFKAAKSESADIKALLKKLEGTEYEEEIKKVKELIKENENNINVAKENLEKLQESVNAKREDLFGVQAQLKQLKNDEGGFHNALFDKIKKENEVKLLQNKIIEISQTIIDLQSKLEQLNRESVEDIEELLNKKGALEALSKSLEQLEQEQRLESAQNGSYARQIDVLGQVPCGSEYSHCKFIKDAHQSVTPKKVSDKKLVQLKKNIDKTRKKFDPLELVEIDKKIKRHNSVISLKHRIDLEIKNNEIELSEHKSKLELCNAEIKSLDEIINRHGDPEDLFKVVYDLQNSEQTIKKELAALEMQASAAQQQISTCYRDSGYQISRLETLEEEKDELVQKRKEFGVYDLFLKCMHPNGISYQVIKNKLPIINEEINKILANVVEFEVFMVNDDDKLDIMIKHPKHDPRPLEMGSGAEKSLASIAIRLAFLQVTSLPKSDFIILDEPGTSLDPDNLSGFIRILDLIKSYFRTVILISHLDILKDAVDMQIVIDRRGNFAYINQ